MKNLICCLFLISAVAGENVKKSDRKRELDLGYGAGYTQLHSGVSPEIPQQREAYNFEGYSSGYFPGNARGVYQGNFNNQQRNQPQEILHEGKISHVTLHKQIQVPQFYTVPVPVQRHVPERAQIPVYLQTPSHTQVSKPYPVQIEKQSPVEFQQIFQVPLPQQHGTQQPHITQQISAHQPIIVQQPVNINNGYTPEVFHGFNGQVVAGYHTNNQQTAIPVQEPLYIKNVYPHGNDNHIIGGYDKHSVLADPQLRENISGGYPSHTQYLGSVAASQYNH